MIELNVCFPFLVVTWDGEKSLLDKIMEREKKQKKRSHADAYNAELDRGRVRT